MSNKKVLFVGFLIIYLLRLIASLSMGLMPQDAYYYFYSEEMAWSYFDHPPMVAYMLRLFTIILGKHVYVIKLADFIISLSSFYGFYYLSRLHLPQKQAIYTSMFYGSTLMLTILSINTTPDVPMIFFWTWSLVLLHKAVFNNKIIYWVLSGVFMGLTFDSKYTALFLPFGLMLFLLFSKEHRKFIFSKELLITMFFFLLTVFPVYWWNVEHDWISFKFQSTSRASSILDFNFKPNFFLGNLGTQIFLLLPFLFGGVIYGLYKYAKRSIKQWKFPNSKYLFLLSFSLPIIVFFFSLSFLYWVKLNWIMPGYIAAIILTGHFISKRLLSYQLILSGILHILLIIQFIWYPVLMKTDDTWKGWEESAIEVEKLSNQYPDHFIFSCDNYKTSAALSFYLDKDIYSSNITGRNGLQFKVRYPNLDHLTHKNALYIDSDHPLSHRKKKRRLPYVVPDYFENMIELEPIIINDNNGRMIRKFFVYQCIDYRGEHLECLD